MRQLRSAANGSGVQGLVNALYDLPDVIGFALGVHGTFISLYHAEFGGEVSVENMLDQGKLPSRWEETCMGFGLPRNLSPIYVVVYVTTPPGAFFSQHQVPATVAPGYQVIVEQIDPFEQAADRSRHRPYIRGGISVGNAALLKGAGTLGGFFKQGTDNPLILSCTHVLENGAAADIIQQGAKDGGMLPADKVGLARWVVPLTPPTGFNFAAPYLKADATLAEVDPVCTPDRRIRSLNADVTSITPLGAMSLGDEVVFVGKESDYAEARVYRFISRVKVVIRGVIYNFGDVFEIESRYPIYIGSLVQPGDSGSWVVREQANAGQIISYDLYGLLFARNGKTGLCCVGENVKAELERIAGGGHTFDLF